MTDSRSFDRAAGYYDQTRPLPASIAHEGIQAILDLARPAGRFLEVGAGTGRISIPLLERGLDLLGCDLSGNMLGRFHEKYPPARLTRADALELPFPGDCFETVMTVHVLHLIPGWQEALREFRRVLTPEGVYLNVTTWAAAGASIREQVRLHWRGWLKEHGYEIRHPGLQDRQEFRQGLGSMGATVREVEVIRYAMEFTLRQELERFSARTSSETWDIPEEIFDRSMEELRLWTERDLGDLDEPRQDELRFAIDVVEFESPGDESDQL